MPLPPPPAHCADAEQKFLQSIKQVVPAGPSSPPQQPESELAQLLRKRLDVLEQSGPVGRRQESDFARVLRRRLEALPVPRYLSKEAQP